MDDVAPVNAEESTEAPVGRVTGTAAVRAHLTLALGLALCASAFWFEIGRAIRGNSLSWAYVFEWPLLGAFGVYMWWNVLHPEREHQRRSARPPAIAPEYDGMLAAWQQHQAELAASRASGERQPMDSSVGPEERTT